MSGAPSRTGDALWMLVPRDLPEELFQSMFTAMVQNWDGAQKPSAGLRAAYKVLTNHSFAAADDPGKGMSRAALQSAVNMARDALRKAAGAEKDSTIDRWLSEARALIEGAAQ